jgi:hypothetical protein
MSVATLALPASRPVATAGGTVSCVLREVRRLE